MSVNVDKALQVRPPMAVYTFGIAGGGATEVIGLPGVPNNIGGAGPAGAHTLICNFITLQWESDDAIYYRFSANTTGLVDSGGVGQGLIDPVDWLEPTPAPEAGAILNAGEQARYDLSDLFEHGAAPALNPIQYLLLRTNAAGVLRLWRSSGR